MISSPIIAIVRGLATARPVEHDHAREGEGSTISVHHLAKRADVLYEKLRYLVDYKEEHTIRRSAICCILRRKLFLERRDTLGHSLLEELVRGGYLPNGSVTEDTTHEVQGVIERYIVLRRELPEELRARAVLFAGSEIERFLFPRQAEDLTLDAFAAMATKGISYAASIPEDVLEAQIYIGCRRALFDDDQDEIFYALFLRAVPGWTAMREEEEIGAVRERFGAVVASISRAAGSTLGWRISARLKNQAIAFSVIVEIVRKYGAAAGEALGDHERLGEEAGAILRAKYREQDRKSFSGGVRAVLYIFATKILIALLLELPYELWRFGHIDPMPLAVNAFFHPALLFLMVATVMPPGPRNTARVIAELDAIVTRGEIGKITIKPRHTGPIAYVVFGILYASLFALSFGILVEMLRTLRFHAASIGLFLLFLTLVSYFGIRIRNRAKRWRLTGERETTLGLLWDFFTIPIVRAGRWLSVRFSSVNVFVFVMDFIIEAPFKLAVATFDSFISFLKEKKEDPY